MEVPQGTYHVVILNNQKIFPSSFFLIQNQGKGELNRSCQELSLAPLGGGVSGEILKEGKYCANIVYTCMQIEK
jgi:hypothetical protein